MYSSPRGSIRKNGPSPKRSFPGMGLHNAPEIDSVDSQLFESGKDWSYLSDRELYLLGPQGAALALERFQSPRLEMEIAHARELLSMPSAEIKALVRQDPLGLLTMM